MFNAQFLLRRYSLGGMQPMIRKIVNFALFDVGWLVIVLAGKHGRTLEAVAAAMVVVGVNLWTLDGKRLEYLRLLGLVMLIGFVVDSANLLFGVFALNGSPRFPYLCPLWLAALWAAFGTTLRSSLCWLAGRYWLSAVLGAVAGAASYLAGARLGAVTLNPNRIISTAVLAATWALLMPLLVWLAHGRRARPREQETP